MILLNPHNPSRYYPDTRSRDMMLEAVEFFETKGKRRVKEDDHNRVWYADFLHWNKQHKLFATLLTPPAYGDTPDCRWDTWRNCEFNEILAFYGLAYWYTWQVSILGLGPIWMSHNEEQKRRAAELLRAGAVFALGLSERAHGADIYSTEMMLRREGPGRYCANGAKYYIGNGNIAPMVSTFGKMAETGDYVFFVADYRSRNYSLIQNVTNSQSYVAEFALHDYPIMDDDILEQGQDAWDAALNTVNIGKYNLGWASIGICTHAFYEAIHHAANRRLYGMAVTDFPHVKQMLTDAYTRLAAMKLFALRAADYMRVATEYDRRYLLYNPTVKMKVTTQGEQVINLLWDVIAAKGFEKDTYFEMAARDIRALPKLEGTVHVNLALILKFMPNYFFFPAEYPMVLTRHDAKHDGFLFRQGPARGLSRVQFHDYHPAFTLYHAPNVHLFAEQVEVFRELLAEATPDETQLKDTDFLMALGELFTLVVYGQLVLENARIYRVSDEMADQIFDFMVRDFSQFAVQLYSKPSTTPAQMEYCLKMVRKPDPNPQRLDHVWRDTVLLMQDEYEMKE